VTKTIKVYGTVWCRLTFGVREYLLNARLDYEFVDIDCDPQADAFVRTAGNGARRYPVVVSSGDVIVNPTVADLAQLVTAHEALRIPRRRRLSNDTRAGLINGPEPPHSGD
jgi:hypothetical protein